MTVSGFSDRGRLRYHKTRRDRSPGRPSNACADDADDAAIACDRALAWRRARATGGTLALAGASPGLGAGRAVAAGGVLVRDRRRRRLLLFDPLSVPAELLELASVRESVVVLTAVARTRHADARRSARHDRLRATARHGAGSDGQVTASLPSRPVTGAPICAGFARAAETPAGTRRATGFRSASRRSRGGSTTTSCSGSTAWAP